jgi:beta-lactamase superfamily II metal-dependent hydrolase
MECHDPALEKLATTYKGLLLTDSLSFKLSCEQLEEVATNLARHAGSWFDVSVGSAVETHVVRVALTKLKATVAHLPDASIAARLLELVLARIAALRQQECERCKAAGETESVLMAFQVTRRQHPVGQGGFHSAEVAVGTSRFRYIYDCGSESKGAVAREVERAFEGRSSKQCVDLLVLSHLHADHVNGVASLLAAHAIKRVLLPYIVPAERLALLASACASRRWSESYHTLVMNPVEWFKEQSVPDVIFVLPSVENADGERVAEGVPLPAILPGSGRMGALGEGLLMFGEEDPDDATKVLYPGIAGGSVVPARRALTLSEQRPVWTLVPFTHPEPTLLDQFVKEASRALRIRGLPAALTSEEGARRLRNALADPRKRSALAKAFRAVRPDQNLSSMSLYAGPAHAEGTACSARVVLHGTQTQVGIDPGRLGWLATGDAPLAREDRARHFQGFYIKLLPKVATFVVPHHGSRENFVGTRFKGLLEPTDWVIAVGSPNRHKHPDKALMRALRDRGAERRVTQQSATEFVELISVVQNLVGESTSVR